MLEPSNHHSDESPKLRVVPILLAGVVLPLIALVIELISGLCAGALFDPMPSVFHIMLVAAVPLANLCVLLALHSWPPGKFRTLALVNAGAIAVSLFYTLLFLPMLPIGLMGIVFFGLGLLPMAPLLALIAATSLRVHLARHVKAEGPVASFWPGFLLALALLIGIDLPATLTRIGMEAAQSGSPQHQHDAIVWLRKVGNEEVLLRHCYAQTGRASDLLGAFFSRVTSVTPAQAQTTYFRVTGKAFNLTPLPDLSRQASAWRSRIQNLDLHQGGNTVGGQLDGLTLAASRMDGSLDAEAAVAYLEWTMVFKNDSAAPQEARAQVGLPPGAVISRLTLWVDGEEREAAFAGTRDVRAAYTKVVRQQRDPVLVTSAAQDRVLVQLFPVPAHGEMKIRIGITLPALTPTASESALQLPYFHERNFTLPPGFGHAVWVDAKSPLRSQGVSSNLAAGRHSLRATWEDASLASADMRILAPRTSDGTSWAVDTKSPGFLIRQTLKGQTGHAPKHLFVVADASSAMRGSASRLAQALKGLPPDIAITLVWAQDSPAGTPPRTDTLSAALLAKKIGSFDYQGGHDNLPALAHALALAQQHDHSAVLWLHGPQPVQLSSVESLLQTSERQAKHPTWYALQVTPGANHIMEVVNGRMASVSLQTEDLLQQVTDWQATAQPLQRTLERVATYSGDFNRLDAKTSDHLARLWANEEVHRLMNHPAARKQAIELAQRYQLVTPVSGAVVLETAQQFAEAGLEPVKAGSVPTIPEPETWMLISVALGVLAYRARRARNRRPYEPA